MSATYQLQHGLRSTMGMDGKARTFATSAHGRLRGTTLRQAYDALAARGMARGTLEEVGEMRAVYAVVADVELHAFGPRDRRTESGRIDVAAINAWAITAASIVRAVLSPEA